MTMISPERGNLVYLATKPPLANDLGEGGGVGNASGAGASTGGGQSSGAGITPGAEGNDSGSDISGLKGAPATDALKSWLPIVLVGVAVFFIWKYV